ncbi:MAG: hypothetical protein ACXQS8_06450 [Candidatus Helarchaeales archaeon]
MNKRIVRVLQGRNQTHVLNCRDPYKTLVNFVKFFTRKGLRVIVGSYDEKIVEKLLNQKIPAIYGEFIVHGMINVDHYDVLLSMRHRPSFEKRFFKKFKENKSYFTFRERDYFLNDEHPLIMMIHRCNYNNSSLPPKINVITSLDEVKFLREFLMLFTDCVEDVFVICDDIRESEVCKELGFHHSIREKPDYEWKIIIDLHFEGRELQPLATRGVVSIWKCTEKINCQNCIYRKYCVR